MVTVGRRWGAHPDTQAGNLDGRPWQLLQMQMAQGLARSHLIYCDTLGGYSSATPILQRRKPGLRELA